MKRSMMGMNGGGMDATNVNNFSENCFNVLDGAIHNAATGANTD